MTNHNQTTVMESSPVNWTPEFGEAITEVDHANDLLRVQIRALKLETFDNQKFEQYTNRIKPKVEKLCSLTTVIIDGATRIATRHPPPVMLLRAVDKLASNSDRAARVLANEIRSCLDEIEEEEERQYKDIIGELSTIASNTQRAIDVLLAVIMNQASSSTH